MRLVLKTVSWNIYCVPRSVELDEGASILADLLVEIVLRQNDHVGRGRRRRREQEQG